MNIARTLLIVLTLVASTYAVAFAQSQNANREFAVTLDPIIVTGELPPTPLSSTTSQVTVIHRDSIAARQADGVTDLLRQVAGLHIDQPGARGGVSSVYLRGADPSLTMVLIDGIKVNDLTNNRGGSFDFSTLNTDHIERIEIVPGPLSAIYGSDALSGVINFITRRGDAQASRQVELAGGRFGHIRTRLQAQGLLGEMDYALSGAYLDNGDPVEGSEFHNTTLHANLGFPIGDRMDMRWLGRYSRSDSEVFPDASGGPDLAVLPDTEEREIEELVLGMTLDHDPLDWWTYQFRFGLFHCQEDAASPGVAPPPDNPFAGVPESTSDATFRRYELTLAHILSPIEGVDVTIGAQAQFEEGSNRGSLAFIGPTNFDFSRDTYAPFLNVQIALLKGLRVQGGVRVDWVDDFDHEVSPRVGAAYTIAATGTTLRVNWGEGFKVPSFFSLADPVVGDRDLRPETSMSVDAGVTQRLWDDRVTLRVSFFYTTYDDLIDFDPTIFRLRNRDDVDIQGVEVNLHVQPWPELRFSSHLTYVDTDIKNSAADCATGRVGAAASILTGAPCPSSTSISPCSRLATISTLPCPRASANWTPTRGSTWQRRGPSSPIGSCSPLRKGTSSRPILTKTHMIMGIKSPLNMPIDGGSLHQKVAYLLDFGQKGDLSATEGSCFWRLTTFSMPTTKRPLVFPPLASIRAAG